MRKKVLSLLAALCLMLSLAPAAFAAETAQPDTVTLPSGETVEIPSLSLADEQTTFQESEENSHVSVAEANAAADPGYSGSGTKSNPFRVYTEDGLLNLSANFDTTNLTISYIYLMEDLDFTNISIPNDYIFLYFIGYIQGDPDRVSSGDPVTIKGLGDRVLVYYWFGGDIGNFEMDMDGVPGRVAMLPGMIGTEYWDVSMTNLTIYSGSKEDEAEKKPLELNNGDAQANYSPYIYCTGGAFTMKNCVNYADITGTSYGSVFYGYYPLSNAQITFDGCVNKGTITMRHAAMFFGNNSAFYDGRFGFNSENPELNKIQFTNCANDGVIAGTSTANLFSTRAAGNGYEDDVSEQYESYLRNGNGIEVEKDSIRLIGQDLGMALHADAQGNLTMTPSEKEDVAYYVVSVYNYVYAFDEEYNPIGSMRYGTSEKLENATDEISLKKYGVCDYAAGTPGLTSVGKVGEDELRIVSYNDKCYYWLNNQDSYDLGDVEYHLYVSADRVQGVKETADIVTLAAYSENGTLLGTVSDTPLA